MRTLLWVGVGSAALGLGLIAWIAARRAQGPKPALPAGPQDAGAALAAAAASTVQSLGDGQVPDAVQSIAAGVSSAYPFGGGKAPASWGLPSGL